MARHAAILSEEDFQIPSEAHAYEGFLRWIESDEFPESGRIDFLAGEIEADMCAEAIDTHGSPKIEIVVTLGELVLRTGLGDLQSDTTRFNSPFAAVSTEPDVVVVLRESLESGRVRLAPSVRKGPEKIMAFEGAVDLIVEIVSDSSVGKDLKRLPGLYARAGVREPLAGGRPRQASPFRRPQSSGGPLRCRSHGCRRLAPLPCARPVLSPRPVQPTAVPVAVPAGAPRGLRRRLPRT